MDYILAIGEAVAELTEAQHGMLAFAPGGAATGTRSSALPMPMPTDTISSCERKRSERHASAR